MVVQYADDATLFLQPTLTNFRNLNITSQKLELMFDKQKTGDIVFTTRKRFTIISLTVENNIISESTIVKSLAVVIDSKLKFDEVVKKILHRMAFGIKVLSTLSKSLPQKAKIRFFNAIVTSHVHHST